MAAMGSGNPGLGVPEPVVGPVYLSGFPVDPAAKPTASTSTLVPPMYGPELFFAVHASRAPLMLMVFHMYR